MNAPRKITRLEAANDQRPRKASRRVSVVAKAPTPKTIGRVVSGSVLLIGLGLMGMTVWLAQKDAVPTPAQIATSSLPSPQPRTFTDIVLPASSLSPDASLPEDQTVNIVASKLGDLPAVSGRGGVQPSSDDEDPHDLIVRASALLESQQYDEAIGLYDQALALEERNHDALTGKAFALAKSGETEQAISVEQRVLKLYPHDDTAAANLAHLLMQTGQHIQAITYLDRAAREAPDRVAYRRDLAALYDRTGHRAEAVMLYRQVLDSGENGDTPAPSLARIRQRLDYLERMGAESNEPSTTVPVDN